MMVFAPCFLGRSSVCLAISAGLIPLTGACVMINGSAVVLIGAAGCGKSTLAAALVLCGASAIADDFVPISAPNSVGSSASPKVLSSFPSLRLWEDSARALGISSQELTPHRRGKRYFEYGGPPIRQPASVAAPIQHIVLVDPVEDRRLCGFTPLESDAAAPTLMSAIHQMPFAVSIGVRPALNASVERLVCTVPISRMRLRFDLNKLHENAARLIRELEVIR